MSSRLCVAQNFLSIAEVCVKIIFKRYKHISFYNNTIDRELLLHLRKGNVHVKQPRCFAQFAFVE